jgi:hypothetical protein
VAPLPHNYHGWNCSDPNNITLPGPSGFGFSNVLEKTPKSACWQTTLGNGYSVQAIRDLKSTTTQGCDGKPAPCLVDGVRLCRTSYVGLSNNPAPPICSDPNKQPSGFGPKGCEKCVNWLIH